MGSLRSRYTCGAGRPTPPQGGKKPANDMMKRAESSFGKWPIHTTPNLQSFNPSGDIHPRGIAGTSSIFAGDARSLKGLTDEELGVAIGYPLSIDESLFLKDLEAATERETDNWDPNSFAYGVCVGDGYINRYGAITQ